MPLFESKVVDHKGIRIVIKSKRKTTSMDEDHAYLIKALDISLSDLVRAAMNDYISSHSEAQEKLNEYYDCRSREAMLALCESYKNDEHKEGVLVRDDMIGKTK